MGGDLTTGTFWDGWIGGDPVCDLRRLDWSARTYYSVIASTRAVDASPDGTGAPVLTSLTINTNGGSPVVGALHVANKAPVLASVFYLPGGFAGFLLLFNRRRFKKNSVAQWLIVLLILLAGAAGLVALVPVPTAQQIHNSPNQETARSP